MTTKKLPKTIIFPDTDKITDKNTKDWAEKLISMLDDWLTRAARRIPKVQSMEFEKDGVEWRHTIVGDDFQIQQKVDGEWTEGYTVKSS